ncbi:hypothetical protein ACIDE9_07635 [Methylophilus sp. 'Pure River']|uniref:hypothetical protein n=1 Tax=Methylophilus sp. 'Pure River' TaxID=3377117 RepID=UPI00398F5CEE
MLRGLIYGLSILHLGPGFAFAVVAFGCEGTFSFLQGVCQQDAFAAFIKLTLAAWGVMISALLLKILVTNYINKNK